MGKESEHCTVYTFYGREGMEGTGKSIGRHMGEAIASVTPWVVLEKSQKREKL